MKGLKVCVLFIALVLAGKSFAGSGSATVSGGSDVILWWIASSDCSSIKSGLMSQDAAITDVTCSADPVVLGTTVLTTAYGTVFPNTVTALTATPSGAVTPAPPASQASAPADTGAITETGRLTVVLVMVAVFFSGLLGYRSGSVA